MPLLPYVYDSYLFSYDRPGWIPHDSDLSGHDHRFVSRILLFTIARTGNLDAKNFRILICRTTAYSDFML